MRERIELAPGYYILLKLPEPKEFDEDGGMYFYVGRWVIRYERKARTFEIVGAKSRIPLGLKREIIVKPWWWP